MLYDVPPEGAEDMTGSSASSIERAKRQARIRKLLNLAGGDPATTDPEKVAAHAKAEVLWGERLAWGTMARIRSIAEALAFMNIRRPG